MTKTAERTLAELRQRIAPDHKAMTEALRALLKEVRSKAEAAGLQVVDDNSNERHFYVNVCRENDWTKRGLYVRADADDISVVAVFTEGPRDEQIAVVQSELVQRGRMGLFGPKTVPYPDGTQDLEPAVDAVARAMAEAETQLDKHLTERREKKKQQ